MMTQTLEYQPTDDDYDKAFDVYLTLEEFESLFDDTDKFIYEFLGQQIDKDAIIFYYRRKKIKKTRKWTRRK